MRLTRSQQEGHDHDVCPSCGAELCGGKIRETIRGGPWSEADIVGSYGDSLCYSRTFAIEDPRRYDGVCEWLFPCCGAKYDRFTGEFLGWVASAFIEVREGA